MKKRVLMLTCVAIFCSGTFAKVSVKAYDPKSGDHGVTYYLPRTQLDFTITAVRHTYTPGELCMYCERFLGLSGVSDKSIEEWSVSDISMQPCGIPDPERVYTIAVSAKGGTEHCVELTDQGIISAINTHSDPKSAEEIRIPVVETLNATNYLTEDILLAGSLAKKAELVAKEIFAIRESRNLLVRGQSDYMPQDGQSMALMLENLNRQEMALMQMFTGVEQTETKVYQMSLVPAKEEKEKILFRISNKLGVVGVDNLAGEPVFVSIEDLQSVPKADVSDSKSEHKFMQKIFGSGKKTPETSVCYCVPGKAAIKVRDNRNTYMESTLPLAQFGNVKVLSANLFDKGAVPVVTFDTNTGNIMSIER